MSKKNGLKVFNRADYWKNVLNYNRNQVTCLLLEEITIENLDFINDNFWINFITYQKPKNEKPLNLFFKNGELKYSPAELKDINYALYIGKDKNIIYPLWASGITIITKLDSLELQTPIERVDNFSRLDNLT